MSWDEKADWVEEAWWAVDDRADSLLVWAGRSLWCGDHNHPRHDTEAAEASRMDAGLAYWGAEVAWGEARNNLRG